MNIFIIAYHNLKLMISNSSKIFFIVVSSIIMSTFGLLFYSGYFLYNYYLNESGTTITLSIDNTENRNEIINLINSLKVSEVNYVRVFDKENNNFFGEYNSSWDSSILFGENHSWDDNNANVLLPEYLVDFVEDGESPLGMKTKVDGIDISVKGVIPYSERDGYILPIMYYVSNLNVSDIIYSYRNKLDNDQITKVRNLVNNNCVSHCNIESENPFGDGDFIKTFIQILMIFIVIIVNVFCMIYYWVMHFKRYYKIYAICGNSKEDIIKIIALQTFAVMIVGAIAGNTLFGVFRRLISKYELVYQGDYSIYNMITVVMLIILMLFSLLLAKKAVKSDSLYNMVG